MEMWVGAGDPDCGADDADWIELTDPNAFTITTFLIADGESFERDVAGEDEVVTVRQREIKIILEGELKSDSRDPDRDMLSRRVEDTIRVRNDFISSIVTEA
jgi:hypothetical protein